MNLESSVGELPFIGPAYLKRLEKLDIRKIKDLLYHVPARYLDLSRTSDIKSLKIGETITIKGEIVSIKNQYTRSGLKIQLANISDGTGEILAVWFNQPFLVRVLYPGVTISLAGEVGWFGKQKAITPIEYEKIAEGETPVHTGKIIPIYPETYGISSKWLRVRVKNTYKRVENYIEEFLPTTVLSDYNLISLPQAISAVHFPESLDSSQKARERLAFDELLFLQLQNLKRKINWQKNKVSNRLAINKLIINKFIDSLPFKLTNSQKIATDEIFKDLGRDYPMNRLLEGDVGSGKTVVAAIAVYVAFSNGCQTIFMAPTQILAQQHFETLNNLFANLKLRLSLVTSETKKKDLGRIDIFIGTHALIHQKLNMDKVGLVIIDEQHRFGVEQRASLVKKTGSASISPHVLTMTATPIPRTVALTFYGDLDLSTLDELPAGRQKITTWVVGPQKRQGAYKWMKLQIVNYKCQIFIVCPLIEESQVETMKQIRAATSEFESLKNIFKGFGVGLLHGRQSAKEKNKVLSDFRSRRIDILVATPVVEVGIDIPNATMMVIEGADRFGLAQLHQLRGRVGRGNKKSYCLLFTESSSQKSQTRLTAITKNFSGFELAELDLKLRGPGEIFGTAQSGFPELKIANWSNFDLIKKSKEVAEDVLKNPQNYPKLIENLKISS